MISTALWLLMVSVGSILVLPWSMKTAEIWSKETKKWYNYLVAGLMVGIIALGLRIYASGSVSPYLTPTVIEYYNYLVLLFETVAAILGAVGLVGIIARVWSQR